MNTIFFGEDGFLRSGWRAAIFLFLFILTAGTVGFIGQMLLDALGLATLGLGVKMALSSFVSLTTAIFLGWLCGKHLEKLPFRALGASFEGYWFRNFVVGSAFGIFTFSFAVAIAFVFGGLRFELNSIGISEIAIGVAGSLMLFAVAAAFEEALFRGYILQTLDRSGLAWLAILLTSLFFGLVHAGNPNASLFSIVNTVLAGIWFSVAYLKTRDLWFVTGLHMMWNWAQGAIFGIEVSGLTNLASVSVLKEIDSGPTWLTGQSYGIEGGVACTIASIISTIAILALPKMRSNFP